MHTRNLVSSFQRAITVLILLLVGHTAARAAADLSATVEFDISAQRLPSALIRYSEQSGVQVTSAAELLDGRQSSAIKGAYAASVALTNLLAGTGLDYQVVDPGTVSIRSQHSEGASNTTDTRASNAESSGVTPVSDSPLQEVIVTAQKRAENALKVPISITAVTQESLDSKGIKDINDFSRIVPGVSLIATGGQSTGGRTVVIRGISATAGSATTGVYIDETPIQGRESGSLYPAIFDLERVEVLRGPQGTLFGAGSEGGTVRFITPAPGLDKFSATARTEVSFTRSGDPSFEAGFAAGGPVKTDVVGARASLWARRDGGFVDRYDFFTNDLLASRTNSSNSYAGRLALLIKPSDTLTITPSLHYQRVDKADSDTWWSTKGIYQSYFNIPQPTREEFYLPSLAVEYQLGSVSLKSISSYYGRKQQGINRFFHSSKQQLFYPQVPNYSLADFIDRAQNNFTQELRLTSAAEQRLSWVAGVFYMYNREVYLEFEDEPLADDLWLATTGFNIEDFFGVPLIDGHIAYRDFRHTFEKETAGFADVTWKITGRLKASAGVRVSRTEFGFDERSDGPFGVSGDLEPLVTSGASSEKPVTPKLSLSYETDEGVLYGSVRKGYRVGGANQLLPNICQAQLESLGVHGAAPPYTSDKVWSYELGAKHRFASGRVQLAGSAFRINWSQIQGVIPLNTCAYTYVGNFGTAVSQGIDLQASVVPVDGLELSGSIAYIDAKYTETVPVPGSTSQLLVRDGDPLLDTPEWQGDLSVQYRWTPRGNMDAYVRTDVSYSGGYVRTYSQGVNGFIGSIRDGSSITDVSLRAGVKFSAWDLSGFVKNLTDDSTALFETVGTVPNTYGSIAIRSVSRRPRTFGVGLAYHY